MRPLPSLSGRNGTPVSPDLASRIREAALLEGDFVLSSGQRSSFYLDKYLFSTEPDLLRDVAAAVSGELPAGIERLAGVELGAVPLVVATALVTGLPYVIVRKFAKGYGTGRGIEGNLERGERVALIEDVVTTGTQAVQAARSLVEAGVEVVTIVAVLDRREVPEAHVEEFSFKALLRIEELRVPNED
jgi:orotate phosphoribosyltransferase